MWAVKLRGNGSVIEATEVEHDETMLATRGLGTAELDWFWGFGDTEEVARARPRNN